MEVTFRPMTAADARVVLSWRYGGPYALYDADPDPGAVERGIAALADPANAYFAALGPADEVSGFCCFGAEARVQDGVYDEPDALDIGVGLRPDLTGQGLGYRFFLAVLDLGRIRFAPPSFRVTVAAFNARAIRVYERAGFQAARRFMRGAAGAGRAFVIMVREA